MPNGDQSITADANANDAHENEADYIITTDSPNDIKDVARRLNERTKSDVTNRNDASEAARSENSDWPNSVVSPKKKEKFLPNLSERQENDANFSERNSSNENNAQNSPKDGDDIIVPEISQCDDRNENMSPKGGKYNLRPNQSSSENYRY